MAVHFWVGSFCGIIEENNGRPTFPRGVIAISDIITLIDNMGNQIPDKSWKLYLFEMFNKQDIASELNLICQFDNQDYFEAIFGGINRYRFRQVLPIVSHSYLRQIVINSYKQCIDYILEDLNTRQLESFELSLLNSGFMFEARNHFTGLEWWNKVGNITYHIRYHVEVSQLMYGLYDNPTDSESLVYLRYNTLIPNNN